MKLNIFELSNVEQISYSRVPNRSVGQKTENLSTNLTLDMVNMKNTDNTWKNKNSRRDGDY